MRAIILCSLLLLPACTRPGRSTSFDVPAGAYAAAFDAARDALREHRFTIDRVDAREGVITTAPKPSAGLFSPWDREQTTFRDEAADLLHDQQRVVTIRFEPAGIPPPTGREIGAQTAPAAPPRDLTTLQGPLRAEVTVVLLRLRRGTWRTDADSIYLSTFASDTTPDAPPSRFYEPIKRDPRFASHLAELIAGRLAPDEPNDDEPPDQATDSTSSGK